MNTPENSIGVHTYVHLCVPEVQLYPGPFWYLKGSFFPQNSCFDSKDMADIIC